MTSNWEARIGALLAQQRLTDAARVASEWRRAEPRSAAAEHMAGDIAVRRGDFEFARARYESALRLDPERWTTWSNLSGVGRYLGDWTLQQDALLKAISKCPLPRMKAELHSNRLIHMHALPDVSPEAMAREIKAWSDAYRHSASPDVHVPPLKPESTLRVAFVSGAFSGPILSATLPGVLTALDRSRIAACLIDSRADASAMPPQWVISSQLDWRHIPAPHMARSLEGHLDVLVDLDGHAPSGVLHLVSGRIAPVQVCWLDWFNSTGVADIDYWLGDALSNPPELDYLFNERVWRLPHFRLPYRPHPDLLSIPLRLRRPDQPVVFGAFGRIDKHHPALFDAWAEILKAVPQSVLVVKASVLSTPAFQARYREQFSQRGVGPEQIQLLGNSAYRDHLASYANIDVVLDTVPYNGGVSSFDALSMGTAVLSTWGEMPVARQSAALMSSVNLARFVAKNLRGYVENAIDIGRNPEKWLIATSEIQNRFLATPMASQALFAENLANALRAMYEHKRQRDAHT
jgi:protein O-GlcNAc transferase